MTRVRNGERRALDMLYGSLSQGIYGYLRRMGAHTEDAADIVQLVLLRIAPCLTTDRWIAMPRPFTCRLPKMVTHSV